MRRKLAQGRWWVQAVAYGLPFGVVMAVVRIVVDDRTWLSGLLGGMLGGVVFGLLMGATVSRRSRHGHSEPNSGASTSKLAADQTVHRATGGPGA